MKLFRTLRRKIRTSRSLPPRMIVLAVLSILLTMMIRIALWIVPFRVIRRATDSVGPLRLMKDYVTARQIAWLVDVGSRYVYKATCLTQALTARVLLNAAGLSNELHIGVARADRFESHAWIEHEGRVIVGGAEQSARYSRILILENPKSR